MNKEFRFTIPLNPVTKKNSQRVVPCGVSKTGTPHYRPIPSRAYKDYEEKAIWYLKKLGINQPCEITALFYMPTRRRVDLTNLLEALDDILVKAGTIVDDNYRIIFSHDGSRVLYDKDRPRTEVTIKILDKDSGGDGV